MAARGRRKKGEPPPYLRHSSGQAYVFYNGEKIYLGAHGSPESYEAYNAVLERWRASQESQAQPVQAPGSGCSLTEMVEYALSIAEKKYRVDGEPTDEVGAFARALSPLLEMGARRAASFTPRDLKRIRQEWIDGGMGRKTLNRNIGRVKRAFRWAVSESLIPVTILTALETVDGISESEFHKPDPPDVTDAPWEMVEQVLPHLNRQLRTMVLLQWHMGCRPGEVCRMKGSEIAQDGKVQWKGKWFSSKDGQWVFQPSRHKNRKRGKFLAYVLSQTAKTLLEPWLRPDPAEYLFQPQEAEEERRQALRAARKSKVPPSQMNRRKANPERQPGKRFRVDSYIHAVEKACAKAFPPPPPLGRAEGESLRAWQKRLTNEQRAAIRAWAAQHSFSPNQLRHAFLTRIERQFSLIDAAKAVGHARIATTEIYISRDLERASEIAAQLG